MPKAGTTKQAATKCSRVRSGGSFAPKPGSDTTIDSDKTLNSKLIVFHFVIDRGYLAAAPLHQNLVPTQLILTKFNSKPRLIGVPSGGSFAPKPGPSTTFIPYLAAVPLHQNQILS